MSKDFIMKRHIYFVTHCQTLFNRKMLCDCSAEIMAFNAEKFFRTRHSCHYTQNYNSATYKNSSTSITTAAITSQHHHQCKQCYMQAIATEVLM